MPFVRIPGVEGKVFVPDEDHQAPKKHNCPDCASCQWCAESRCRLCRKRRTCPKRAARERTR